MKTNLTGRICHLFLLLQKQFHTQPSPERLDAQIRSLSFSQDTLIKQLMERNEELVKQNAAILAELSASRKLIEKLMTVRFHNVSQKKYISV